MVKAATLVGPKKIEIREYPLPEASNGFILVKMIMSGICGTDKNSYKGYLSQYSGTSESRKLPLPIIPGQIFLWCQVQPLKILKGSEIQ